MDDNKEELKPPESSGRVGRPSSTEGEWRNIFKHLIESGPNYKPEQYIIVPERRMFSHITSDGDYAERFYYFDEFDKFDKPIVKALTRFERRGNNKFNYFFVPRQCIINGESPGGERTVVTLQQFGVGSAIEQEGIEGTRVIIDSSKDGVLTVEYDASGNLYAFEGMARDGERFGLPHREIKYLLDALKTKSSVTHWGRGAIESISFNFDSATGLLDVLRASDGEIIAKRSFPLILDRAGLQRDLFPEENFSDNPFRTPPEYDMSWLMARKKLSDRGFLTEDYSVTGA